MNYIIILVTLLFTTSVGAPPPSTLFGSAAHTAGGAEEAASALEMSGSQTRLLTHDTNSAHSGEILDFKGAEESGHTDHFKAGESIHTDQSNLHPHPNIPGADHLTLSTDVKLIETRKSTQVPLMVQKDTTKLQEAYQTEKDNKNLKRLIIMDNDGTTKPFKGKNGILDRWRLNRALKKLVSDPKNEVWFVTALDVKVLEKTYGHIPGLNMVGKQGMQFSEKNVSKLDLPDKLPMEQIHDKYLTIAKERGFVGAPRTEDYRTRVFFAFKKDTKEAMHKQARDAEKAMNEVLAAREDGHLYGVGFQDYSNWESPMFEVNFFLKDANDKGFVPKLLFKQRDTNFGVSLGDSKMDEAMHQVMRQHGHHGILVKDPKPRDLGYQEKPWDSTASYSLSNHKSTIKFLENLPKPPISHASDLVESSVWVKIKDLIKMLIQRIKMGRK